MPESHRLVQPDQWFVAGTNQQTAVLLACKAGPVQKRPEALKHVGLIIPVPVGGSAGGNQQAVVSVLSQRLFVPVLQLLDVGGLQVEDVLVWHKGSRTPRTER